MKHKKLRTVLITVVVIAALVAAYMIAFMRPQPLLDCLGGTEAPTTGTLTVYDQAHQEGQKWDVAEGSELDEVWQAMQSSQVRFLRGHGVVTLPDGGAYYEVKLANADGSSSYAFGCNSEGDLIIAGSITSWWETVRCPRPWQASPRLRRSERRLIQKREEKSKEISKIQLIFADVTSIMLR